MKEPEIVNGSDKRRGCSVQHTPITRDVNDINLMLSKPCGQYKLVPRYIINRLPNPLYYWVHGTNTLYRGDLHLTGSEIKKWDIFFQGEQVDIVLPCERQ
jgi:hypothetical protein